MAAKTPPPEQSSFDLSKIYLWMKGLESKVNNLLREVDLIKNDFVKKHLELKKEVKLFNEDLLELKREQEISSKKMDLVIKELKRTAGKEEVDVLKKYMEYWNPMNFVTQRDLERAVESKIATLSNSNKKKDLVSSKERM